MIGFITTCLYKKASYFLREMSHWVPLLSPDKNAACKTNLSFLFWWHVNFRRVARISFLGVPSFSRYPHVCMNMLMNLCWKIMTRIPKMEDWDLNIWLLKGQVDFSHMKTTVPLGWLLRSTLRGGFDADKICDNLERLGRSYQIWNAGGSDLRVFSMH